MPKCPNCELEIDHVISETNEFFRLVLRLPENDKEKEEVEYDPDTGLMSVFIEDSIIVEDKYICPLCRKEIAQDEEEVAKFLKGG